MSLKNLFWGSATGIILDTAVQEIIRVRFSQLVCALKCTHMILGTSWALSVVSCWRHVLIFSNFWHYPHGLWIALWGKLCQWVASGQKSYSTDLSSCRKYCSLKRCLFDLISLCKLIHSYNFTKRSSFDRRKRAIYGCLYQYIIYPNTRHFMYSREWSGFGIICQFSNEVFWYTQRSLTIKDLNPCYLSYFRIWVLFHIILRTKAFFLYIFNRKFEKF